jgi:hypothetical protein
MALRSDRMPLGARGNALTANPTTSENTSTLQAFHSGIGGVMSDQQQRDEQDRVMGWAPEGSIQAKLNEGVPLTPGERLLAVTLLGLPVSKDAA